MSEIPADILATAREVANKASLYGYAHAVNEIGRAILAERERCADIASGWEPTGDEREQYAHGSHYIAGLDDAGDRIAAAIRKAP